MDYHKEFMRTQNIASDFAKKFNEALLQVEGHFLGEQSKGVIRKLPRMHFLEPTVVEVKHEGEERNILVEEFLEGDYKKFNSNMGYVEKDVADLVGRMNNLGLGGMGGGRISNGLGAIVEGDSEEDSDSDEEEGDVENIFDSKESVPQGGSYRDLQDAYFPQAFSHFSYEKSKHMFMVVDLQGVFTINADGTKCYNLTDPVVHKNRKKKQQITKHWSFGRTDRGEKGMKAFFETHHCTDACRILGLTET